jgi:very-short-patch-repair endonuclease
LLLECEGIVERKSVDEADEGKRCCIFVDGKEHACFQSKKDTRKSVWDSIDGWGVGKVSLEAEF